MLSPLLIFNTNILVTVVVPLFLDVGKSYTSPLNMIASPEKIINPTWNNLSEWVFDAKKRKKLLE